MAGCSQRNRETSVRSMAAREEKDNVEEAIQVEEAVVLICTFPSPAGLTSPKELTKARPVTQAHSTTQVRTPSRDVKSQPLLSISCSHNLVIVTFDHDQKACLLVAY